MAPAKYKDHGRGWLSKKPTKAFGSGPLRDIFKEAEEFKSWERFKVGKGDRVLFWHDTWCGSTPLVITFPDLYALALLKNGVVKEHMVRDDGGLS